MSTEIAEQLQQSEDSISEGYEEAKQASAISLGVLAGTQLASQYFFAEMPEGIMRNVMILGSEAGGYVFAGAVVTAATVTVGREGASALYHEFKAWRIARKETKAEWERLRFTWPLDFPPSQLNGNL